MRHHRNQSRDCVAPTLGARNNFENNSNIHCYKLQTRTILFTTRALARLPMLVTRWRITTAHLMLVTMRRRSKLPLEWCRCLYLQIQSDKYRGICAYFHQPVRPRRRISALQKNACLIYAALAAPTIQSGWASAQIVARGIRCSDLLKQSQRPACCRSVFIWTQSSAARRNH